MNTVTKHNEPEIAPIDPVISMIERVASDPTVDIAKLEQMLALKERLDAKSAQATFAAAFAAASAEFPSIPLNGKGHNGKPYATLKDIMSHTRPALSKNGLVLSFSTDVKERVVVTAKLMHKAGHTETTSIALPTDTSGSKNPVQAVGSSQTYGERYTAQAILGLSLGEDTEDDGGATGEPVVKGNMDPWIKTIIQDMPADATPRDKAEEIARALCSQWRRKNSVGQLNNEWDRRAKTIDDMEARHPDLHETICDNFDARMSELKQAADPDRMPRVE